MPTPVPTAPLPNGAFPMIGFGTFRLTGEDGRKTIANALEVGYRHIDTAAGYGNHAAVAAAIKDSQLAPEEFDQIDAIDRWERLAYGPLAEMAGLR